MSLNLTLILQIISFLILMFILTKVFYRPLLNFLDQRAQYTSDKIKKTEEEKNEAEERNREAEKNLTKAQEQVLEWKDLAKREIEAKKKDFLGEMKKEKEQILDEAKQEIDKEVVKSREKLKKEVSNISLSIAEKILKREIEKKDKERLIKEGIEKISNE